VSFHGHLCRDGIRVAQEIKLVADLNRDFDQNSQPVEEMAAQFVVALLRFHSGCFEDNESLAGSFLVERK